MNLKDESQPARHILSESAEYATLMHNHLDALKALATHFGLTIQTAGFVVTFTDAGQHTAAYHGCTCITCAARTLALLQKGIVHAVTTVGADAIDTHGKPANHAGGLH